MPRSKRVDASVLSPRALLVARTDDGLKYAASKTMRVVPADTSESAPPITPPIACAFEASAITNISGLSERILPSSVLIDSPGFACRTTIAPPPSFARSKACIGWPSSSST